MSSRRKTGPAHRARKRKLQRRAVQRYVACWIRVRFHLRKLAKLFREQGLALGNARTATWLYQSAVNHTEYPEAANDRPFPIRDN